MLGWTPLATTKDCATKPSREKIKQALADATDEVVNGDVKAVDVPEQQDHPADANAPSSSARGEKPAAPVPEQPESSSSSNSSSSDDGSSSEEDKGAPKPAGKASGREPQETVPAKSKAKAKARMDTAPKPKAKTKSAAKAKAKEPARPKVALLDTSDVKPDRFVKMRLDMAQDDAMAEAASSGVKRRRK